MKKLAFLFLSLFAVCSVSAQVTTASMDGMVTDEQNQPLVGATVIAVHVPSGTQYGAVSNIDGRFAIQGMRTGGPYTVKISYVGYAAVEYTDIMLSLGTTYTLDVQLKESTELDAIIIVSTGANRFDASKTGAATNFTAQAIATTPTINRSIYDIVKMTPQASVNKQGGMSFAGANNRYNSFQIDGAVSNDVFGLSPTGTNGGQTGTNAVSLDAIEEIQVVVAPFDVRQSGFTGGGINAITKSGTNAFKGSAYTYYNNQDFFGTTAGNGDHDYVYKVQSDGSVKAVRRSKLEKQSTQTYGVTLGGPILKDKLFFFVSGEFYKEKYPSSYFPGYTSGYLSEDQAKEIADRYEAATGIRDSYGHGDSGKQSVDVMARVDWNINRNNKLAVRYQLKDAYQDVYGSGANTYYFKNSAYRITDRTHSVVVELNSRLTDNLSNELRVGATLVRDNREVAYQGPTVQIDNMNGFDGKKIYIGTEYSSGANKLDQDVYIITDNLSWYKGTHTFTFGTHNEIYHMNNLFMQAVNGSYYYNSINDFVTDNAYKYQYKYADEALTGNPIWAATLNAAQFGFYAQDEWKPSRRFTLGYGLRIDIPVLFSDPMANDKFNSSAFAEGGRNNVGRTPSTKVLWSPRMGFRWYMDENHRNLLRGGAGLFTGRVPFVWISNIYNNTGVELKTVTAETKYGHTLPPLAKDPVKVGDGANPDIAIAAKNFKYPQVFRANLAYELSLESGWKFTVEGIYSKTMNNVYFENLAAKDEGKKVYAISQEAANPDNSCTYYTTNIGEFASIVNLRNTNKGYTYNLSAMVQKHFNIGMDLMVSYSFGHSYSVNDGGSSVAYSNWKYNYARNTNDPNELSFSMFDIPHRLNASLSYTSRPYADGRLQTVVGLVYRGYSGQRYSLTLNESADYNGDGWRGNSMMYIPTDGEIDKMNWVDTQVTKTDPVTGEKTKVTTRTAAQNKSMFKQWVESDKYAKEHRGEFAERCGAQAPFEHHFDFHISENVIYCKKNNAKVQFSIDIMNVGNLLNRSWGRYYPGTYNLQILGITGMQETADGNYTPKGYVFSGQELSTSDVLSRWHMQLGLRVTF